MAVGFYRDVKPPVGARLLAGHPLVGGLEGFWTAAEGAGSHLNEAGGRQSRDLIGAGQTTWAGTSRGTAIVGDGATAYYARQGASAWIANKPTTIWVLARVKQNGANQGLIGFRGGSLGFYILHIANSTTMEMRWTSGTFLDVSTTCADGIHSLALSFDGVTLTSWRDGVAQVSSGGGNGPFSGVAEEFRLLSDGAAANLSSEAIIAAGIWSRVLSSAEQRQMATAPFELFAPPIWRRIFSASLTTTSTRTATPVTAALLPALVRTATPVTAALLGTRTRTATPVTIALLTQRTRTATPITVALQVSGSSTLTRTATPLTVALLSRLSRSASPVTVALLAPAGEAFSLVPSTLVAGLGPVAISVVGIGTNWTVNTVWHLTMMGAEAVLSHIAVLSPTAATWTLAVGLDVGTITLQDDSGGSAILTVTAAVQTPLAPLVVLGVYSIPVGSAVSNG